MAHGLSVPDLVYSMSVELQPSSEGKTFGKEQ